MTRTMSPYSNSSHFSSQQRLCGTKGNFLSALWAPGGVCTKLERALETVQEKNGPCLNQYFSIQGAEVLVHLYQLSKGGGEGQGIGAPHGPAGTRLFVKCRRFGWLLCHNFPVSSPLSRISAALACFPCTFLKLANFR